MNDRDLLIMAQAHAWEYFCKSCHQLRLSTVVIEEGMMAICQNCLSSDIIRGAPGTLDKAALMAQFPKKPK